MYHRVNIFINHTHTHTHTYIHTIFILSLNKSKTIIAFLNASFIQMTKNQFMINLIINLYFYFII